MGILDPPAYSKSEANTKLDAKADLVAGILRPDQLPNSLVQQIIEQYLRKPDVFATSLASPPAYDIPNITMATTAPTGTLVRELRSGGASGPVDMAGDAHFLYDGATTFIADVSNPTLFVKPDLLPGGGGQAAYYQSRISFVTSAATVAIKLRFGATATGIRVRVGRRWVSEEITRFTGLTAGNTGYLTLQFPSNRSREISIENSGSTLSFGGVIVPSGATITRPAPYDLKLAVLGDSYSGGSGTPPDGATRLETWADYLALALEQYLGLRVSFINFGIGGTGYIASATPFSTRVDGINLYAPDILIILGSRNDGNSASIQAGALSVLQSLSTIPEIYVSGPSTAGYEANNTQVQAAAIAAGRVFLDGLTAQWITAADFGIDGIHPTFAGHKKLAQGMLSALMAGRKPSQMPAVLLLDTFQRTVSSGNLLGVSDDGKTWTTQGAGTVVIDADGAGYSSSASTGWNAVATASDGTFEAVRSVGTTKKGRLIFRQSGSSYLMFYGNGTNYAFTRITAAGSAGTTITSAIPTAGDNIKIVLAGQTVTISVNSVQVYTSTDPLNVVGNSVGIATFTDGFDTRWRSVKFTATA